MTKFQKRNGFLPQHLCLCRNAWWRSAPHPRCGREIINTALEGGCELLTAVGTHQHHAALFSAATPSLRLKCHPSLSLHFSPINYWFSPPQQLELGCGNGPHASVPVLYRAGRTKVPSSVFLCWKWAEVGFREGRGQSRTAGKAKLRPTCPLAACMSELLQGWVDAFPFFFYSHGKFAKARILNIHQTAGLLLLFAESAVRKTCLGSAPSTNSFMHLC